MAQQKSNKTLQVLNLITKKNHSTHSIELNARDFFDDNSFEKPQPTFDFSKRMPESDKKLEETLAESYKQLLYSEVSLREAEKMHEKRKKNSYRKKEDTNYSSDPVAEQLKVSLAELLKDEEEAQIRNSRVIPGKRDNKAHIFFEGGSYMENNKLRHTISPLGNQFVTDSLDSVETANNPEARPQEMSHSSQEYMFVNVAEEIVRSKVPDLMKDYEMCTCERCTNDVVALALNRMPPKYVVTMKGKLYARINSCLPQYQTDLITAISEACKTVKSTPRHTS